MDLKEREQALCIERRGLPWIVRSWHEGTRSLSTTEAKQLLRLQQIDKELRSIRSQLKTNQDFDQQTK